MKSTSKKKQSECCERYKKKGKKPCKDCPLATKLSKKELKTLLAKYAKS